MNKHAYLIIAHNQFDLLKKILTMLDDERNDFYIHIDKKVKDFDSSAFDGVLKHSNLTFCDRVNITWGDFSQIQSEMTLFKAAASANEIYSYYHLISGVDLPIKSKDEIYSFFEKNYPAEFVHFSLDEPTHEFDGRIKYYHFFRKKRNLVNKALAQCLLGCQKLCRVDRLKNQSITVAKGTNWVSVTAAFVKYLVENEEYIAKTFSHSYCGDEVFLQTMLFNSPFAKNLYMPHCGNNQLACARLIDWNRGNPYVFTSSDFDEIISSDAMFARKFDLNTDSDIVDKIFNYVMEKNNDTPAAYISNSSDI